jgi:hypothetical protein
VDADVLVFAPQRFVVDDRWSFALCHEIRIAPGNDHRVRTVEGVNNCVSLYRRGNPFLQFQIFACQSIVANASRPIGFLDAGTRPLTGLSRHVPLPLLTTVGLFTPRILEDIVAGGGEFLRAHADARKGPVYAANLCHSATLPGRRLVPLAESVFLDAIERLVETRGAIVNDVSTVDSRPAPQ